MIVNSIYLMSVSLRIRIVYCRDFTLKLHYTFNGSIERGLIKIKHLVYHHDKVNDL